MAEQEFTPTNPDTWLDRDEMDAAQRRHAPFETAYGIYAPELRNYVHHATSLDELEVAFDDMDGSERLIKAQISSVLHRFSVDCAEPREIIDYLDACAYSLNNCFLDALTNDVRCDSCLQFFINRDNVKEQVQAMINTPSFEVFPEILFEPIKQGIGVMREHMLMHVLQRNERSRDGEII